MLLHDYIFENLRWKLAALLLAVLAWFSIQLAMRKGFGNWRAQTLRNQPVQVLTAPSDLRAFRIDPAEVEVVLRPRPGTPWAVRISSSASKWTSFVATCTGAFGRSLLA